MFKAIIATSVVVLSPVAFAHEEMPANQPATAAPAEATPAHAPAASAKHGGHEGAAHQGHGDAHGKKGHNK